MRSLLSIALVLAVLAPAAAQDLQVRIEPASVTMRAGTQVSTTAHAAGGTAPYRFEWFVGNERTGEVNQRKVWLLRRPGRYVVRVVATDGAGRTGTAEAAVTVEEFGVRLEGSDPLTASAYGMTPPFRFQVFLGDRPQGPERPSSSPRESFPRPQAPGAVRVRVTDANGLEAWGDPAAGAGPPPPVSTPDPGGDLFE